MTVGLPEYSHLEVMTFLFLIEVRFRYYRSDRDQQMKSFCHQRNANIFIQQNQTSRGERGVKTQNSFYY
jgi:hypothetical protein